MLCGGAIMPIPMKSTLSTKNDIVAPDISSRRAISRSITLTLRW